MPETTLFTDGILEASVTHGVVRITLGQAGADGKPVRSGRLAIPLVQLPGFANGLLTLLRQVDTKLKEAQQAAGAAPAAGGTDAAIGGAFRFGS